MSALLLWDRLRPDPIGDDTTDALRCEIRDPLWLIARQWQMRELVGSDAGSVAVAHAATRVSPLTHWSPGAGGAAAALPPNVPLDAVVERRPAPFDLQLRLETGREWLRMLREARKSVAARAFGRHSELLVTRSEPTFAPDDAAANALAHDGYAGMLSAVAGRMLDGERLYLALANRAASSFLARADRDVDALGMTWRAWVHQLVGDAADSWEPRRLTYSFSVSATGSGGEPRCLAATAHDGRGIDWTSFDHVPCPPELVPSQRVVEEDARSFIPAQVRFAGMPGARWWELEDESIDFGSLRAPTTDIGALLLAQFALLYSTDWLALSLPIRRGSLAQLMRLDVTDVFGVTSSLSSIYRPGVEPLWELFRVRGDGSLDALLVPHAHGRRVQGTSIEEVQFVRDEVANLVWAIEARVSDGVSNSMDGRTSAVAIEQRLRALAGGTSSTTAVQRNDADRAYRLATDVMPHMIPFMPIAGRDRLTLRRAAIPRVVADQPITRIRARTQLVRRPPRYELDGAAIPQSGVALRGVWRRARSSDGATHTWFAYERIPSERADTVALKFDQIAPVAPASP